MKRETIKIQLPKQKRRIPELFSNDTPFKPKVQKRKDLYQRQSKIKPTDFD